MVTSWRLFVMQSTACHPLRLKLYRYIQKYQTQLFICRSTTSDYVSGIHFCVCWYALKSRLTVMDIITSLNWVGYLWCHWPIVSTRHHSLLLSHWDDLLTVRFKQLAGGNKFSTTENSAWGSYNSKSTDPGFPTHGHSESSHSSRRTCCECCPRMLESAFLSERNYEFQFQPLFTWDSMASLFPIDM